MLQNVNNYGRWMVRLWVFSSSCTFAFSKSIYVTWRIRNTVLNRKKWHCLAWVGQHCCGWLPSIPINPADCSEPTKQVLLLPLPAIGLRDQACDQPRPMRHKGKSNGGVGIQKYPEMSGLFFLQTLTKFQKIPWAWDWRKKMPVETELRCTLPRSLPTSRLIAIGDKFPFWVDFLLLTAKSIRMYTVVETYTQCNEQNHWRVSIPHVEEGSCCSPKDPYLVTSTPQKSTLRLAAGLHLLTLPCRYLETLPSKKTLRILPKCLLHPHQCFQLHPLTCYKENKPEI